MTFYTDVQQTVSYAEPQLKFSESYRPSANTTSTVLSVFI